MKSVIGEVIHRYRMQSGLSQDQLVDKIDMSKAFLSEIERGIKMPSVETLFRISKALGVNASEIVVEIEKELKL